MRLKTALPILWLPLIGVWTFLLSVQLNKTSTELESIVPLITYVLVSFLLVLQLQLVIGNKKEAGLVKFGTANVLLLCLLISTVSILVTLIESIPTEFSIALIVAPLIMNTITAEIFSVSNKAVTKKAKAWVETNKVLEERQQKASEESAKARNISVQTRDDWKKYLQQASIDYLNNSEIIDEITRIKDILQFSSYFRAEESSETLKNLQEEIDESKVLIMLRDVK